MSGVYLRRIVMATSVGTFTLASTAAQACTSFLLKTSDSGYVYGRTLEFGIDLKSKPLFVPRNYVFKGTGTSGEVGSGLSWKSKYAAVGLNGVGLPVFVDGFNEKGLGGGLLYAPNTAVFQDVSAADSKYSIASYEILTYALSNFANVEEAKEGFRKLKVNRSPQAVFKGPVPLHMTLHDAQGKSIVIEYHSGELEIFDNPTGVMTNDPGFDWHLAHLGLFGNLSPKEAKAVVIGGKSFGAPSSGSGLHGIPGDFLSPSRFVRATAFASSAPTDVPAETQVMNVFHILNNFDIPPGGVQLSSSNPYGGGSGGYERTEWMTVSDLRNQVLYIKTFDNQHIQKLELRKLDLNAKQIRFFDLQKKPVIVDLLQAN